MFDVVGRVDLGGNLGDKAGGFEQAFARTPWNQIGNAGRKLVRHRDYEALHLRRLTDPEDCSHSAGLLLTLIGEAWMRWDKQPLNSSHARPLTAEELLRQFQKEGESFIKWLKGNFIIVLYDASMRKCRMFTSRFLISPLYYHYHDGRVLFSTSVGELIRFLPAMPSLDHAAIVETILFNFPMKERTFVEGVNRVTQATTYTFDEHAMSSVAWSDLRDLYGKNMLKEDEAMELGGSLFHRSANDMSNDHPRIAASFTSGFDSRVLHAVLEKDHNSIHSYSFGISGSLNVEVPQKICAELGFPFQAIYLDDEYEAAFDEFAWQTIALSDGLVVQRANYPYAFKKISEFAPVVLTGLFGSELLRTFQNLGTVVSQAFDSLNRSDDPAAHLSSMIDAVAESAYLLPDVWRSSKDQVLADVSEWFRWSSEKDPDRRLYLYLLSEVDRKYFGAEISTERIYATTRFPFLDDEFVEFAFTAPFAGVHSKTITPTVENRFRSQMFYARTIKRYRPELLRYETDHGFSPGDLLKSFPLMHVGPKHLLSRVRRRLTGYQEFKPKEWLSGFYENHLFGRSEDLGIISPRFSKAYRDKTWLDDIVQFDKVASLKLWLEGAARR